MSQHLYTFNNPPSEKHLDLASKILGNGGIICYPVGANWAFGCDASKQSSLDKIRALKPGHPKSKSFSLICSDISMAANYGQIDHTLYRVLRKIWPGPYTIIVKRTKNVPRQLKDKREVVGLRVPECSMLRALIERFGMPIASTSLPRLENEMIFTMGYQIEAHFGHAIDLILDLGEELTGEESTVVDYSQGFAEIVRQGLGEIEVFGTVVLAE